MQSVPMHEVTRRRLAWAFPGATARDWFAGSVALTALLDTLTLAIPDNERYYVRTLHRDVGSLSDPHLRRSVREFFAQEMLHGRAHCVYWANLRSQGVNVDGFTRIVGKLLYGAMEPKLPHRVNVASVAAIEHVNAYLAHASLSRDLLSRADPPLRRLFEWHFGEKIEHKGVAFDVLTATYAGYATRAASALIVFFAFHVLLAVGTTMLLLQRRQLFQLKTVSDLWRFWVKDGMLIESLQAMGRYLKPWFHPWALDDYALAQKVLREIAAEVTAPEVRDAGE